MGQSVLGVAQFWQISGKGPVRGEQALGVGPPPQSHGCRLSRYWQANGGVTHRDPDGREVVFVSWVYGLDRT